MRPPTAPQPMGPSRSAAGRTPPARPAPRSAPPTTTAERPMNDRRVSFEVSMSPLHRSLSLTTVSTGEPSADQPAAALSRRCRSSSGTIEPGANRLHAMAAHHVLLLRVERIAQAVADEGERQQRAGDEEDRDQAEQWMRRGVRRALGDHLSPARDRVLDPEPRTESPASMKIDAGDAHHEQRRPSARPRWEDVLGQQAPVRGAQGPRRQHVLAGLQGDDLGPGEAGAADPARSPPRKMMIFSTPAPQTVTRMIGHHVQRDRGHDLDEPQEHVRRPCRRTSPRQRPIGMPIRRGQDRDGDADEHRRPGPVQDPAQEVATDRVGPERMARAGRKQGVLEDRVVARCRRQEVGEDRGEQDQQDHDQADDREPVAEEPPCRSRDRIPGATSTTRRPIATAALSAPRCARRGHCSTLRCRRAGHADRSRRTERPRSGTSDPTARRSSSPSP